MADPRKPIVVDITGTPEAGKTTVVKLLPEALQAHNIKALVISESAENSPPFFPKNSDAAKIWIHCDTIMHVLEALFQTDYDVVLFDRGLYNSLFFLQLDSLNGHPYAEIGKNLLENTLKNYLPDLLLAFTVNIDVALKRRGGPGRIVTRDFLEQYNSLFTTFVENITTDKKIIDTSDMSIDGVVKAVTNIILEKLNPHN